MNVQNTQEKPIYYMFGNFFGLREKQPLTGSREYQIINGEKDRTIDVISKGNIDQYCKLGIPISMLAANVEGLRFMDSLDNIDMNTIGFFDIETTDSMEFVLGKVNDKTFTSSEGMLNEMLKFKILVGFNAFQFDLHLMRQWHPKEFYYQTINDWKIPILPYRLVLDLYFFSRLWKPYGKTHSLTQLAKDIGFEEERADVNDKETRCTQDIAIMRKAYQIIPPIFKMLAETANCDWYFLQNSYFSKIRKFIYFKSLVDKGFVPAKYPQHPENVVMPRPSLYNKKGMFKDAFMYDIASAYPSTAILLGDKLPFIYLPNDFTEVQKKLFEYRGEMRSTAKFLMNAMIGDQMDRNNLFRNELIWKTVVETCAKNVMGWVNDHEQNVLFSHTDSMILDKDIKPEIPGYDIELKHSFAWLAVFNQTRYLGYDKKAKEIVRAGFTQKIRIPLFDLINSNADKLLLKGDFRVLEDNGGKDDAFAFLMPWIEDLDDKYFAVKVLKKDDVCRNQDYWKIWDSLPLGFNNLYLSKTGYTPEFNRDKETLSMYLKMLYPFVRQYILFDQREKPDRLKNLRGKK